MFSITQYSTNQNRPSYGNHKQITWVSNPCVPPAAKKPHLDADDNGIIGTATAADNNGSDTTTADSKASEVDSDSKATAITAGVDDVASKSAAIAAATVKNTDADDALLAEMNDEVVLLDSDADDGDVAVVNELDDDDLDDELDGGVLPTTTTVVVANAGASEAAVNNEELPLEDEEEEEDADESEDRSWRR